MNKETGAYLRKISCFLMTCSFLMSISILNAEAKYKQKYRGWTALECIDGNCELNVFQRNWRNRQNTDFVFKARNKYRRFFNIDRELIKASLIDPETNEVLSLTHISKRNFWRRRRLVASLNIPHDKFEGNKDFYLKLHTRDNRLINTHIINLHSDSPVTENVTDSNNTIGELNCDGTTNDCDIDNFMINRLNFTIAKHNFNQTQINRLANGSYEVVLPRHKRKVVKIINNGGGDQNNDNYLTQVMSDDIVNGEVKTEDLADFSITEVKLAENAVNSEKIKDFSIELNDLSPELIASLKADLGTGNVDSSNIADGSITLDDLSLELLLSLRTLNDSSVNSANIIDGEVKTEDLANQSVTANKLANDSVSTLNIIDKTIIEADIADEGIDSRTIKNGSISLEDLSTETINSLSSNDEGSIGSNEITNGSINVEDISNDALLELKSIEENSIMTEHIIDGEVKTVDLADLGVTSAKIAFDAIDSSRIADASITNADLANNSINSATVANGSILLEDLDQTTIDSLTTLDNSSVDSATISDGSINESDLNPNLVASLKELEDNSVNTQHIIDGGVNTVDIANQAITTAKLGVNSVESNNIMDGTIQNIDLAPNSVTGNSIADASVDLNHLSPAIVASLGTAGEIADNSIETNHIVNGTIQSEDLAEDITLKGKVEIEGVLSLSLGIMLPNPNGGCSKIFINSDNNLDIANADCETGEIINSAPSIEQEEKLLASDGSDLNNFGTVVAMNDQYVIVGSPNSDSNFNNSGAVYVYDMSDRNQLHILRASDANDGHKFGSSISLFGNLALIGAPGDASNGTESGSAYIFNVDTGTQVFKLTADDAGSNHRFGSAVSINNSYAVVGAEGQNSNTGATYVFNVTDGSQVHKLVASDGGSQDLFGNAISISGSNVLIGSIYDDSRGNQSGAAYVFDLSSGNQTQKLIPDDGTTNDQFASSVALEGDIALIGSWFDDDRGNSSGSAYIFDISSGTQLRKITASDGSSNNRFGSSVALSHGKAIIGSPQHNNNGSVSGAVFIYDANSGDELQKILASDYTAGDLFGQSVSAIENIVVSGSPNNDDQGNNSGSAYLIPIN